MSETKYGKYFVSKPIQPPLGLTLSSHPDFDPSEGGKAPPDSGIYLSEDAIPGCPVFCSLQRTVRLPPKQPFIVAHKHKDVDEYILFIATGKTAELGTTVTFAMGEEGEKHQFHETTAIYVPKGLVHCPIWYGPIQEDKEFYLISFLMQPNYPME
jgi:hypothetical protein